MGGLFLGAAMVLLILHLAEAGDRGTSLGGWLPIALALVNRPVLKPFQHTYNFSLPVMVATILGYWVFISVAVAMFCFLVVRKARASLAKIRAEVPDQDRAAAIDALAARGEIEHLGQR